MHPTERYKEAVRQANDATIRKFNVRGPYTPGTPEHAFWLEAFDSAIRKVFMTMNTNKTPDELIRRIKDALGTDEDGDSLVEVARNAHRAERELAGAEAIRRSRR